MVILNRQNWLRLQTAYLLTLHFSLYFVNWLQCLIAQIWLFPKLENKKLYPFQLDSNSNDPRLGACKRIYLNNSQIISEFIVFFLIQIQIRIQIRYEQISKKCGYTTNIVQIINKNIMHTIENNCMLFFWSHWLIWKVKY
jgi:hypothetical protein